MTSWKISPHSNFAATPQQSSKPELCVMMPASKPALADAIWALIPRDVVGPTGHSRYILYGGSIVHRIPWQRDTTYNDTCRQYTKYVTRTLPAIAELGATLSGAAVAMTRDAQRIIR